MERLLGEGSLVPLFSREILEGEQSAKRAISELVHCSRRKSSVSRSDSIFFSHVISIGTETVNEKNCAVSR